MEVLSALIAARSDRSLEASIFGAAEPAQIADTIGALVGSRLGEPSTLFYRPGTGLVIGFDCDGVGEVVVKVHRRETRATLAAAQRVQTHLADAGFPAPRPLLAPTALAGGIVTAEELIRSERVDGRAPEIRRELATGLCELITIARDASTAADLDAFRSPVDPTRLWGEPHDLRFDFEATSDGAAWIDRLATEAQRVMRAARLPPVVAHFDWRAENAAFRDGRLVGVYDWDSLGLAQEAIAVGQASAQFSTDWTVGHRTLPTIDDMAGFVADYVSARGHPFGSEELALVDAANLMVIAYAARCEHSDRKLHAELAPEGPRSWTSLLEARAERLTSPRRRPTGRGGRPWSRPRRGP